MKVECAGLNQEAYIYEARSVFVSLFRIIAESQCSGIGRNTVKYLSLMGFGTIDFFVLVMKYPIDHQSNLSFLAR